MAEAISLYGYRLRPQQERVLAYRGGRMAVSAVPGSGKTLTLALLAARMIVEGRLSEESDVLVVTVQNSAVANITQQIRRILYSQRLPPVGYHVCTLHKLANDILRQRHDLAGVEESYPIVDEAESQRTMRGAAEVWIASRRAWWESLLPEASESQRAKMIEAWRSETERVGREVVKLCKHLQLTPVEAQQLLPNLKPAPGQGDEFLDMGIGLYALYERYLQARSGLDFDDLIWRALGALDQDATFLANLRARWPIILEDEAQDSSPLQERILEKLCGERGNWVRVGDPNQSINSTFTAADPRYFRRFAERADVQALSLPQSGRCARPIIQLANQLVAWACDEHPEEPIREMAFERQMIAPTDAGDTQPNPPDELCHIRFYESPFPKTDAEAGAVAGWAASYLRRYPDRSAAILCPAQWQGGKVVEALEAMTPAVPFDDLLRSTPQTRNVARILAAICQYLGEPTAPGRLAQLYGVLLEAKFLGSETDSARLKQQRALIRSVSPHDLLFPRGALTLRDLLPANVPLESSDAALLDRFAALVGRWVRGLALPVDQLILSIAQDLFQREDDLAICHTIAASLRAASDMHPNWRLPDFAAELGDIARNQRALGGLSLADAGYQEQKGRVVVTTMHKAKGLEWDAVFLMCVDSLEFPDSCAGDFRDEPYYMPTRAPAVEARKRLEQLAGDEFATPEGRSVIEQARLEVIAERLRLLYVGITRARLDLALTWSEINGPRRVRLARAAVELARYYGVYLSGGD